jgi:hypothetical protein
LIIKMVISVRTSSVIQKVNKKTSTLSGSVRELLHSRYLLIRFDIFIPPFPVLGWNRRESNPQDAGRERRGPLPGVRPVRFQKALLAV